MPKILLIVLFSFFTVILKAVDVPDIFSGNYELINAAYPAFTSMVTANIPFGSGTPINPRGYQHAVSLQYVDRYTIGTGVKFSLICQEAPTILGCTFKAEGFVWARLRLVYLVSLRQDFYCGRFSQTLQAPSFETLPVFLIEPWTASYDPAVINIVPMISGVNASDPNFGLQLINTEFLLNGYQALLFDVLVTNFFSSDGLLRIQINYLLYLTELETPYIVQNLDPSIFPTDADYMIGLKKMNFASNPNTSINPIPPTIYQSYNFIPWVNSFTVNGIRIIDGIYLPLDLLTSPGPRRSQPQTQPQIQPQTQTQIQIIQIQIPKPKPRPRPIDKRKLFSAVEDRSVGRLECPSIFAKKISHMQTIYRALDRDNNLYSYLRETDYMLIDEVQRNLSKLASIGIQAHLVKPATTEEISAPPQFFVLQTKKIDEPQDQFVNRQEIQNSLNQLSQYELYFIGTIINSEYTIQKATVATTRCIQCQQKQRFIPAKKRCVPQSQSFPQLYPKMFRYLLLRPYLLYLQTFGASQYSTLGQIVPGRNNN